MTGREKLEAALAHDGADEIGAVICYEGIFIRDHWEQLTRAPWWHREALDLDIQMAWRREVIQKTGQDWFCIAPFYSYKARKVLIIEPREDGIYRVDISTGRETKLAAPQVGGWEAGSRLHSVHPARLVHTEEEVDALIPEGIEGSVERLKEDGSGDLAQLLQGEFGQQRYPLVHVSSPLWNCYQLWGFEGLMTTIATRSDLVERACRRFLGRQVEQVRQAAILGAAGIWIEECLTDMISPDAFARLNLPVLRELVETIRATGMHSIYYFCGNPTGKWELLLEAGADALSLEESKKGFTIDIEQVVDKVQGRCAILGNIDSIGVMQKASDTALRAEVLRQLSAGRRNDSRFIMSLGSPVTPGTPVERVRRYCDLVHELGRRG